MLSSSGAGGLVTVHLRSFRSGSQRGWPLPRLRAGVRGPMRWPAVWSAAGAAGGRSAVSLSAAFVMRGQIIQKETTNFCHAALLPACHPDRWPRLASPCSEVRFRGLGRRLLVLRHVLGRLDNVGLHQNTAHGAQHTNKEAVSVHVHTSEYTL